MTQTTAPAHDAANKDTAERIFQAGAHFGYVRSRRHPSVQPFIFGQKQRIDVFDLEKTGAAFEKARQYAHTLGAEGKTLLLVGGKPEAQAVIVAAAEGAELPYVIGRWIGGTLTNFAEIRKRMERMLSLISQREKGELIKYTKHERLLIDREIAKLETMFGGLRGLHDRLPDALFVVDTKHEHIAVKEAQKLGIPVIGLMNTDCDLTDAAYPIPANDSAQKSISFFVNEIVKAYTEGVASASAVRAAVPATPKA